MHTFVYGMTEICQKNDIFNFLYISLCWLIKNNMMELFSFNRIEYKILKLKLDYFRPSYGVEILEFVLRFISTLSLYLLLCLINSYAVAHCLFYFFFVENSFPFYIKAKMFWSQLKLCYLKVKCFLLFYFVWLSFSWFRMWL